MKRRELIAIVAGVAVWPLLAHAQRPDRMRRVGVLVPLAASDVQAQSRVSEFSKRLQQLGWTEGRDLQIENRWGEGNGDLIRKYAAELIALEPDVIFAAGNATVAPLLQATRAVPIVFAIVPDPVGAGFVESLSRPGGNATGFTNLEYAVGAKWLELLKQIAPRMSRTAVLRDSALASGAGQYGAIQSAAPSFGVELTPVNVRDAPEIERAIAAFARAPNGGLIVTGNALAAVHRDLIIKLAAQYTLPAIYFERFFATSGGLISYGPDFADQYRQAAGYVDRILKGEKPADLPVQAPTKYELNQNTIAIFCSAPPSATSSSNCGRWRSSGATVSAILTTSIYTV
jgi:putative tryptophan/tyrosine transport system substrate-binding protein